MKVNNFERLRDFAEFDPAYLHQKGGRRVPFHGAGSSPAQTTTRPKLLEKFVAKSG